MSVCPHGTESLLLEGFLLNFWLGLSRTCRHVPIVVKVYRNERLRCVSETDGVLCSVSSVQWRVEELSIRHDRLYTYRDIDYTCVRDIDCQSRRFRLLGWLSVSLLLNLRGCVEMLGISLERIRNLTSRDNNTRSPAGMLWRPFLTCYLRNAKYSPLVTSVTSEQRHSMTVQKRGCGNRNVETYQLLEILKLVYVLLPCCSELRALLMSMTTQQATAIPTTEEWFENETP